MERTIQAPPQEWLSAQEASSWVGIEEAAWLGLARRGQIPPGLAVNKRNVRWHWREVWAVSELLKWLRERPNIPPDESE